MEENGVHVNQDWILPLNDINADMAFSATIKLFSNHEQPDAIFAVSDVLATGAIRAVNYVGKNVPKDGDKTDAVGYGIDYSGIQFRLICFFKTELPDTCGSKPIHNSRAYFPLLYQAILKFFSLSYVYMENAAYSLSNYIIVASFLLSAFRQKYLIHQSIPWNFHKIV